MRLKLLLHFFPVVLLSFGPVVGAVGVARSEPVVQPGSPATAASGLHYDGLYTSKSEDKFEGKNFNDYLRFYPDGTVVSVLSTGDPALIAAWLNRNGKHDRGTYAITANAAQPQIQFIIKSLPFPGYAGVTIAYQGTLQNDKLTLQSESSNGHREQRTYEFVAVQFPELVPNQQLTDSKAGLVFKSTLEAAPGALNIGTVVQRQIAFEETQRERGVEYVDNCPKGKKAVGSPRTTDYGIDMISQQAVQPQDVGRSEARAWFTSQTTPPSPGLRVVVRNLSQASSEELPFTNREYNQAPRSEDFIVALGKQHNSRFLSLNRGINELSYEIKRGEQIVESGKFTIKVTEQTMQSTRMVTIPRPKQDLDCVNEK
jgi:hypothetical protein